MYCLKQHAHVLTLGASGGVEGPSGAFKESDPFASGAVLICNANKGREHAEQCPLLAALRDLRPMKLIPHLA